jgi:transposase InsO family protein
VSRQAYYQQKKRDQKELEVLDQVKQLVIKERIQMPRLGTRKLYFLLEGTFKQKQLKVGRDRLFSFLKQEQMLIKPRKTYTKTTMSKHWLYRHPNRIKAKTFDQPEQLWVSDITYIKTKESNSYLSLVTDAVSRKIMGYHLSRDLRTESVMKALKMATGNRTFNGPLIHHSDRGLQYCADDYQQLLLKHDIKASMTDGHDCYQNALAERINGILKQEFLIQTYKNIDQAAKVIEQSIYIYNSKRPHLSLGYKTPDQVHKKPQVALTTEDLNFIT